MLVKKKNVMEHIVDRQIPLGDITQATLSTLGDNFVVCLSVVIFCFFILFPGVAMPKLSH